MAVRQIVLDTETTGLEPSQGHRIIEIGCIELINRRITKQTFHSYINPGRDIDQGAHTVHGITNEFLRDKPFFKDIFSELLAFIDGAELIIHNASFDVGFLNHEFKLIDKDHHEVTHFCSVLDTLAMARVLHPGQRNSLDALCKRYSIDNSHRELHGALLDAEILANVYLAMTGGQGSLFGEGAAGAVSTAKASNVVMTKLDQNRQPLRVIAVSSEEERAHSERLAAIEKACGHKSLWQQLDEQESL